MVDLRGPKLQMREWERPTSAKESDSRSLTGLISDWTDLRISDWITSALTCLGVVAR